MFYFLMCPIECCAQDQVTGPTFAKTLIVQIFPGGKLEPVWVSPKWSLSEPRAFLSLSSAGVWTYGVICFLFFQVINSFVYLSTIAICSFGSCSCFDLQETPLKENEFNSPYSRCSTGYSDLVKNHNQGQKCFLNLREDGQNSGG